MRILLVLFALFLCWSCKESLNKNKEDQQLILDRIEEHYKTALRDSVKPADKRTHINQALYLSQDLDSLKAVILYSKCKIHFTLQEYDSLLYYGQQLTAHTTKINDPFTQGRYYHLMGYYHDKVSFKWDSAFYYHNEAKNQFIKTGDSSKIGRRLLGMGIIQKNTNDHFGAKETLTEALSYLQLEKDQKYIASVYNELGTNNNKLLNYSDAIVYYKRAIITSNSKRDIAIYKNNLARAYTSNKDYSKAIQLLEDIRTDGSLPLESTEYARVLDNLAHARWFNGEVNSLAPFLKALNLRKQRNDRRGQIASYTHLGEFHSKAASKIAIRYFDTVVQMARQLKIPKAEKDALTFLMGIAPKNDTYKSRYIFLQDSMYKQELLVKTQFAKMKYDDRLSKEAILRLETDKALKTAELSEQRAQKVIYISLSSLLLLFGGSFFYYIRQKHKKEKMEQVYATEKRISKKVHDELANDIYGVMSSMQHATAVTNDKVLDTLEHIYHKTRDISHETGDIDTRDFYVELKKLLAQYRSDTTNIAVKGLEEALWTGVADHKKIALYRVLHELLVNMKKHSSASLVSLNFGRSRNTMTIGYIDNGTGISDHGKKGNGLRNAENRIHSINGTFIFESGKGVKITIAFPA